MGDSKCLRTRQDFQCFAQNVAIIITTDLGATTLPLATITIAIILPLATITIMVSMTIPAFIATSDVGAEQKVIDGEDWPGLLDTLGSSNVCAEHKLSSWWMLDLHTARTAEHLE